MTANDTRTPMNEAAEFFDGTDEQRRLALFAAQAKRIAELQSEISARQEEVDDLKARILDSHPVGTYEAGALKVQVKAGAKRLDAKRFQEKYPPSGNPTLYEVKPKSLGQVGKLVGELNLQDCITNSKPTVVVS